MRDRRKLLVCLLLLGLQVICIGTAIAYERKNHSVGIWTSSPPAALYVKDSQGNITGVDTKHPISDIGGGEAVEGIPNSQVDHYSLADDENEGAPLSSAVWGIVIADGGDQGYTAYLLGVARGVTKLDIYASRPAHIVRNLPRTSVLMEKGVTKELSVVFSPGRDFELTVTRKVGTGDLDSSLRVACGMGLIAPAGICRSLKAKAEAADAAIKRGSRQAAAGEIRAFLNELKAQGNKHVKEPALTILREEAEALLKSIEATTKVVPPRAGKKNR